MKDRYLTPLRIAAAVTCMLMCHSPLLAQQALKGIVRVKVSKGLATQLESRAFSRTATGEVQTGIASLDRRNRQFKARRFTRVFPNAGKYESRHRKHGLHLWYTIVVDDSIPVSQMIASYRSDTEILSAEPVYEKAIVGSRSDSFRPVFVDAHAAAPLPDASNDPLLNAQWHYHNTGQTGGTPGADIKLFEAWKTETGNRSVIVAVTDGGVQTDHPDLAANLWTNADEVAGNGRDDDNNGYVDDIHGYGFVNNSANILPDNHGTHVAGTIAAVNNNGVGVAGVAGGSGHSDGVRVMSCAVFSNGTSDGFAQAYVYSADNGAVISQNSWGYTAPHVYEQVVLDAIDYFIAEAGKDANGVQTGPMNGGLVIFSAGNYNEEAPYYPAAYAPVLAVTSTTHKDRKATYANYGTWVDIAAPGGETYQDEAQGVVSTLTGGQYGAFMGTSMACPHVSGVAALFLSKFGQQGMRPETLRTKLLQSVDDIRTINPEYAGKLGSGRLNAQLALRTAEPPPSVVASGISWEKWAGIAGTSLSDIPVAAEPTATALLDNFITPANAGDQYGQRIRGFIHPPADGYYTFFIASNDRSALALSTDESEGNKRTIASVNAYTNPGQWDKYASQASAKIYLEANRTYYIEALHKEGVGSDHLAVGWQLPDGTMQRPVPGTRLSPFEVKPSESSPLCSASGTISREYWTDIPGSTVSDIPVGSRPDGIMALTSFEGPLGAGAHYGARISGYLCAPATGDYYFWIASNDHSELWLSSDDDPANKVRIAFVSGATGIRQWNKNASQRSARIPLTAGKRYYIEALHKQGVGSDHIAVGWQLPDGTLERPMRGDYLSPFVEAAAYAGRVAQAAAFADAAPKPELTVYPNPVEGNQVNIALENVSVTATAFADVEISDLSGVTLYTKRLDCREGCGMAFPAHERLQPGIYIVRLRAGNRLFTEKLIVR